MSVPRAIMSSDRPSLPLTTHENVPAATARSVVLTRGAVRSGGRSTSGRERWM